MTARLAPEPAEIIRAVCAQIDRRLGNPAGTAERGCYFWFWPPSPSTDATVLARLHADAKALLDSLTPSTGGMTA